MNNDWRPDWTDKNAYPDPKTTSPRQWAWEFLRRNEDYQKLYDEICEILYDKYTDEGSYTIIDPPMSKDETIEEYMKKVKVVPKKTIWHERLLEFGIIGEPPNPAANIFPEDVLFVTEVFPIFEDSPNVSELSENNKSLIKIPIELERNVRNKALECQYLFGSPWEETDDPWNVKITINLKLSLKKQTDAIVERLAGLKKKAFEKHGEDFAENRKRESRYVNYLQVLDAKHLGVNNKEIFHKALHAGTDEPFDGKKKNDVSNYFNAATRIKDGDYKYIAY